MYNMYKERIKTLSILSLILNFKNGIIEKNFKNVYSYKMAGGQKK